MYLIMYLYVQEIFPIYNNILKLVKYIWSKFAACELVENSAETSGMSITICTILSYTMHNIKGGEGREDLWEGINL